MSNYDKLIFDVEKYVAHSVEFRGVRIDYRQYTVEYCTNPAARDIQKMNILVREDMAEDHSAPILFVHRDGGVGEALPWDYEMEYEEQHRVWSFKGHVMVGALNAPKEPESVIARILKEGFVLASPGVRGRDTVVDGTYVGRDVHPGAAANALDHTISTDKATSDIAEIPGGIPATILDLKAAVRYLKYNKGRIPGDPDKIISEGGSSGGGSSALLGASGNSHLFDQFLEDMGAAPAADDIYCAFVDSPIHDFEHIDVAYEWQFGPEYVDGLFADDPKAMAVSQCARDKYISYIGGLNLKDPESGTKLTIEDGSYRKYMLKKLNESLNVYLADMTDDEKAAWLADEKNAGLAELKSGSAVINSFGSYIKWNAGRWMKYVGCYDGFSENPSRENEAFGTPDGRTRHFSTCLGESVREAADITAQADLAVGAEYRQTADVWISEAGQNAYTIRLMDTYRYLRGEEAADIAPYWYVRDGGHHETTGAIFLNLCLLLEERQKEQGDIRVDWRFCWQQNHTSISMKEFDETLQFLNTIR